MRIPRLFLTVILIVGLAACSLLPVQTNQPGPLPPDYWPTHGWQTSTPEQQGMDSGKLADMMDFIQAQAINLHSLLVIRNGYIVLEAYANPYGPQVRHTVESNTKSIIGGLIGIAIEQGKIQNAEQRMVSFFPERMLRNSGGQKEAINLDHLLTMTSGLDCADNSPAAQEMYTQANWVGYLLDLPVITAPGEKWAYCSGSAHILSAVLQEATGSTARDYANQNLFQPLGISEVNEQDWMPDPKGISNGIAGLYLTPRELAKFAFLYLQRGRWEEKQVLPATWIDGSTQGRVDIGKDDYSAGLLRQFGYLFSIFPEQKFYGYLGMAGQDLFVVPEKNLVIVFTSGLKAGEEGHLLPLLTDYILPAAQSAGPISSGPEGEKRLHSSLDLFQNPIQAVTALPQTAFAIQERVFHFEQNPLGWDSLAFSFTEGANQATVRFNDTTDLKVGLDNRFRLSESPNSRPIGMRGQWSEANTFSLDYIILGEFREQAITLQFNEDRLAVTIQDKNFDSEPIRIAGRVQ
jgi:CubicO group peptidase (beta-lactamase class C family)